MELTYFDYEHKIEAFKCSRRSSLAGAVAVHLASMTDEEMRRVPYERGIFVDLRLIAQEQVVALSNVSLLRINRDCELIEPTDCPAGHDFLLGFTYCLNTIGRCGEDDEAHDSPYRHQWDQMNRAQMLQLLVAFVVSMDAVEILASDLAHEGFFD